MIQVSNLFFFFRNLSIALTLFFLHPKKLGLACDIVWTTDISYSGRFLYLFLSLSAFDIWFIIIELLNCFNMGYMVLS